MATWTSPITWTTGAVTAAQFNTHIKDNETWLKGAFTQLNVTSDSAKAKITPALVGARVYKAAAQTITTITDTPIQFDTERFDSDAFHDNATNNTRITIPASMGGYYVVGGHVSYNAVAAGFRQTTIRLNGTTIIAGHVAITSSASVNTIASLSTVYLLAATDYVELMVYQNSGSDLNILAVGNYSPEFFIHRLSST